jgi:hypothetical protein
MNPPLFRPVLRPILAAALGALPFASISAASRPVVAGQPVLLADEEAPKITKKFLHSTKGTYGWTPVKGNISYDFFPDGRVHIQGPDGEATMWEGKWSLKGDQLTITNTTKKETKTYKATVEGEDLLLDGKRYQRQKAE